jgi:uncharacterized protein (TIGR03435 family)
MKTAFATLAFLAASNALAQTPAFEVAVIKPASQEQLMAAMQSGQRPHVGVTIDNNRMDMGFQSLSDILARAYDVSPSQIVGPDFLKTEHFDILAKLPAGGTEEQVPQMLQALLAERFKLVARREKKETPIYALVVSKGGLNPKKIKPATAEEISPEPMEGDQTQNTPFGKMTIRQSKDPNKGQLAFMPGMGTLKVTPGPSGVHIEVSNLTTSHFAQLLMQGEDRVVVDKTGLKGSYEASIDISMDGMQGSAPQGAGGGGGAAPAVASTPAMNPMFLAVEQLGLRMEPQKDVVDMLVIDHIEKAPTDN